jgi:hypothetical protein
MKAKELLELIRRRSGAQPQIDKSPSRTGWMASDVEIAANARLITVVKEAL